LAQTTRVPKHAFVLTPCVGEKLRDILDAKSTPARVLFVEDEPLICVMVAEWIEETGIKVDIAGSGTEALNKLRLNREGSMRSSWT
jgi:hypothetical protein